MSVSPREALAEVLDGIQSAMARAEIAKAAGVSVKHAANAQRAIPIPTVAHLRLCAALGLDPLPELSHAPAAPADFNFAIFAMGFKLRRGINRQTDEDAAEAIGISASSVCRIEKAHAVSISVTLKGCKYIGAHPFAYFGNGETFHRASRETPTEMKSGAGVP